MRIEEILAPRVRKLRPEPRVRGTSEEAQLSLVDDALGNQSSGRKLEQMLGLEPVHLQIGRDASAVFDDAVVEEWNSDL